MKLETKWFVFETKTKKTIYSYKYSLGWVSFKTIYGSLNAKNYYTKQYGPFTVLYKSL